MKSTSNKPSAISAVKFQSIDEYHAAFPPKTRKLLNQMRVIIGTVVPKAQETISYNIPTFKLDKNLVHYAGYAGHIGFYPGASPLVAFRDNLAAYQTSKGGIQFPLDKPLPLALIKKIVKFRLDEQLKKAAHKSSRQDAKTQRNK